jgi:ribonuclease Y
MTQLMPAYIGAAAAVVVACLAFAVGWFLQKSRFERLHGNARRMRDGIVEEARQEAKAMRRAAEVDAKDEVLRARQAFADETEQTRREQAKRTDFLDQRDASLDKKIDYVDKKEQRLEQRAADLDARRGEVEREEKEVAAVRAEAEATLESIAGMSAEHARDMLMDRMVSEARMAAARRVQEIREEAERKSKRESQKILSQAIQRYSAEHVAETSISVVDLPNDDMKGRIIGREGRNIRAFELATGVDVIIDDTPEAVIISGFDPVRREVARQSLQTLIRDGRIHPGRIEEVVQKATEEMQERVREIGEQACLELDLQKVDPRMYPYIGRLQYRTSYGQNLLLHSKEVASVAAVVASELGLDAEVARRCGFLHDVGKAADHEQDGPHAMIGAKIVRKCGEIDEVINAVEGHHQDVDATSPYTFITAAADAVSASRPGARRESIDTYIKRLENLERIAESFDGVDKSYAIQAGREIRILVDQGKVSDEQAGIMAEEISRRVEGELEYPGQIKVMVLRETRAVAYAR